MISNMNKTDELMSIAKINRCVNNQFIYIIGNNGSGKSTFLSNCAKNYRKEFDKVIALPCGVFDRFEHRSSENYHYIGLKSNTNAVFLSTIGKYITILVLTLIKYGKKNFLKEVLEEMELDLKFESGATLWDKRTPVKRRTEEKEQKNAEETIERYRKRGEEWSEITDADAAILEPCINRDLKFLARFSSSRNRKEYVPPENLSSGYLMKLKMLLSIAKEAEENSLILIDEPEISLHVKWQAELPKLFRKAIINLKNCVIIVATHSPVIISNSTLEDDLIYVIPDEKTIESYNVDSNIETLLFNKFGYLPLSSHVVPNMCADIIYRVTRNLSSAQQCEDEILEIKKKHLLSPKDEKFFVKTLEVIQIAKQRNN
jgi:predicted ATPase